MTASFPASKPTLATDYENSTPQTTTHPAIHVTVNEELGAVIDKVGIDSSTDTDSIDYKIKYTAPVGSVLMFTGSAMPTGWLLCNGSAVSRTAYSALYSVIGTTYGVGDGSTTFNIPDFRDNFPVGAGATYSRASTGGAATNDLSHTHTGPSHTHTGPGHTHTGPSHTHTGPAHTHTGPSHTHTLSSAGWANAACSSTYFAVLRTANASYTSDVTSSQTWSGDSTSRGYGITLGGATDAGGTGATGSSGTDNTGAAGTGATGSSGTDATGAGGTGNTGSAGSSTQENRPPYLGINFIIRT